MRVIPWASLASSRPLVASDPVTAWLARKVLWNLQVHRPSFRSYQVDDSNALNLVERKRNEARWQAHHGTHKVAAKHVASSHGMWPWEAWQTPEMTDINKQ